MFSTQGIHCLPRALPSSETDEQCQVSELAQKHRIIAISGEDLIHVHMTDRVQQLFVDKASKTMCALMQNGGWVEVNLSRESLSPFFNCSLVPPAFSFVVSERSDHQLELQINGKLLGSGNAESAQKLSCEDFKPFECELGNALRSSFFLPGDISPEILDAIKQHKKKYENFDQGILFEKKTVQGGKRYGILPTPLQWAVMDQSFSSMSCVPIDKRFILLQKLLEEGANPNVCAWGMKYEKKGSPFEYEVKVGKPERIPNTAPLVAAILCYGQDKGYYGPAWSKDIAMQCVAMLLRHGADPTKAIWVSEISSKDRKSVLELASSIGRDDIANLLKQAMEHGKESIEYKSPIEQQREKLEELQRLQEQQEAFQQEEKRRKEEEDIRLETIAAAEKQRKAAEERLRLEALAAEQNRRKAAMQDAIRRGDADQVSALMASMPVMQEHLRLAIQTGQIKVLAVLLDCECDYDSDTDASKLLSEACAQGAKIEIIEQLLAYTQPTVEHVKIAIDRGDEQLAVRLICFKTDMGALSAYAFERGQKKLGVEFLRSAWWSPTAMPKVNGQDPFYYAAARGWDDVIKEIDLAQIRTSAQWENPLAALLQYAHSHQTQLNVESIDILCRHGAKVTQIPKELRMHYVDALKKGFLHEATSLIDDITKNLPDDITDAIKVAKQEDALNQAIAKGIMGSDLVSRALGTDLQATLILDKIERVLTSRLSEILKMKRCFDVKKGLDEKEIVSELKKSLNNVEARYQVKQEKSAREQQHQREKELAASNRKQQKLALQLEQNHKVQQLVELEEEKVKIQRKNAEDAKAMGERLRKQQEQHAAELKEAQQQQADELYYQRERHQKELLAASKKEIEAQEELRKAVDGVSYNITQYY